MPSKLLVQTGWTWFMGRRCVVFPSESIPNPPSSRYFIEGMEFYELHLGDEWSPCAKTQGLCFYASGLLSSPGVRVLLYYTTPKRGCPA